MTYDIQIWYLVVNFGLGMENVPSWLKENITRQFHEDSTISFDWDDVEYHIPVSSIRAITVRKCKL